MSEKGLSRRELLRGMAIGALGGLFHAPSRAQSPSSQPAPSAISIKKLRPDISLLSGDGGNVAVFDEGDGLLLIDCGLPTRVDDFRAALLQISPKPVRILFNTHFHFDHTGANEALGAARAKIIAQQNVRRRLSEHIVSEAMGRTFEPLKPEGLPVQTFDREGKLSFGKQKLEYTHFPLAHTDGDSYLFLPDSNILHTGDLFWNGLYPVIDYSALGWIGGMIAASDKLLKLGDAQTIIIPGHGPLGSKDDLKAARDMLATVQERLAPMAKQGRTLEEVQASAPTKDLDPDWSSGRKPDNFVRQAYNSILHHNQNA